MEEDEPHPSQPVRIEDEEHSRRTRIMTNLKDSLLSQLAESNPSLSRNASSIILHRVQQLFSSFNTPTHPPYALMIRRAIAELNEENGSTAKAISYSIQKEYEDLPWAHERILGIQLGKLCENKELVCDKSGRYVLMVDGDGEETGECKGSRKKRKRGKKRNDHNVDVAGERKGKVAKRDEIVERGNELQEGGIKELVLLHDSDSNRSDEPIREEVCTQENGEEALNQSIERVESQAKSEEGLIEVVVKQSQSKLKGSRFIERHAEAEAEAETLAQESQHQDSILQSETTCSSNPTEFNAFVDSQQPLLLPSSKCVPSAEKELSLTQMVLQMSSSSHACRQKPVSGDPKQNHPKHLRRGRPPKAKPAADNQGDSSLFLRVVIANTLKHKVKKMKKQWPSQSQGRGIGRGRLRKHHILLKNKAISGCVNVDNDQLHHGNQGNPKRNLSENSISGDPEQNPPKRPRGRPPKSKTVAIYQGEPSLSSDDGIPSELKPNINKMNNQLLYGRGRGRGRGRGTGRGRGRPPIRRDADHYEKQLQNEDQAMQHGRGRGRGSRGGRGSSGRGRGRPRKLDQSTNPSEEQSQPEDPAEGLSQKPLQLQSEAKQSQEQQGQGCDQNQDADQERPSNPVSDAIGEPPAATPTNM